MLHHLILVFLAASVGVQQCHSFKQVRRGSALPISARLERNLRLPSHCYPHSQNHCQRHFSSAKPLLFSIRGGNDDYDEDEYDENAKSVIASFESELADIRRDAEQEAENEIRKLRELIERRDDVEEEDNVEVEDDVEEEDETDPEYSENIDGSNENDKLEAEIAIEGDDDEQTENDVIREEKLDTLPDEGATEAVDQSKIESDEVLHEDEITEAIDQSEVESGIGDGRKEESVSVEDDEDEDLQHDESELPVEPDEVSYSAESDSKTMSSGAADVTSTTDSTCDNHESSEDEVNEVIKIKKPKKKRKLSKKGRKMKARINLPEASNLSDEVQVDLGESVMLTRIQDEVMQPRQSGIWFYMRSDLGRALGLFAATVILAIWTQRLQRQMEAEGII